MTTKITLGYWKNRDGEKVRVICVDKPGSYPVVACTESGDITTHTADGEWSDDISFRDLIAPWTDPPKVWECWAVSRGTGISYFGSSEAKAITYAGNCGGTIHHLREVNPAREAALEKLVNLVREMPKNWVLVAQDALAELDKAGGL